LRLGSKRRHHSHSFRNEIAIDVEERGAVSTNFERPIQKLFELDSLF
jgi:hypothetical protein